MQEADQVDYQRITNILLKMADWLEDLGFSSPRHQIEDPGTLNRAVLNPRTSNDLAVINEFMSSLAEDINYELQLADNENMRKASFIVQKAAEALSTCIERY